MTGRTGRGRKILRVAVSGALIAVAFGFVVPHVASYRSVWASMTAMTWPYALLVGAAAAASMVSYWITIRAVLPALRLRQAAAVNLGSNAVASTFPAGGAIAMGVSWAMLSSWGLSTADFVLYALVTGIWNIFALLGLPVLALLILTTTSRPDAALISGAAVGMALLATGVCGLVLLLRSQACAIRTGHALQPPLTFVCRLTRRPPPADTAASLAGFRERAGTLLAARGGRITAATVASNLTLWLAAFALIRLLTALPITPGGLGITELGLIGTLAAGGGHHVSVQVTAAVLIFRAVTYLPPIPLGALACLTWRLAPALISGQPSPSAVLAADDHLAAAGVAGQVDEGCGGLIQVVDHAFRAG